MEEVIRINFQYFILGFKYKTYKEVQITAMCIAKALISLGLTEFREIDGMKMRPFGLYMHFCEEQYIADLASMYIGGTTGCSITEELCRRFDEVAQFPVAFVTLKFAKMMVSMKKKGMLGSLKAVIFCDKSTPDVLKDLKEVGLEVRFWEEMIRIGLDVDIPLPRSKLHNIVCLTGTSGTTGNPKVKFK